MAFVTQLRTFLHRYPAISVVVTSREAGFRIVGSALSTVCKHFVLADFDDQDIERLSLGWHREVVGERPEVTADAKELAARISSLPRVKQLAANPLLLTTLLLVRRWVGSLPTKRSVLYSKAIEVLLATWNVEGHAPLDQDEVLPQLEYVAFSMMSNGLQQIGLDPLRSLLIEARAAMPEILSYTKISPSELIDRIELRSSLLMQSGVDLVDGVLMPVYEFRHLTFQEFLCAQAIVNGHYPNANDEDMPLSILGDRIGQENWKEVTLLTMVLAGKRAAPMVEELIKRTLDELNYEIILDEQRPGQILLEALVDEVQLTPDLLRLALMKVISSQSIPSASIENLLSGKYRDTLVEVTETQFFQDIGPLLRLGSILAVIDALKRGISVQRSQPFTKDVLDRLQVTLDPSEPRKLAGSLLLIMEFAYLAVAPRPDRAERAPSQRDDDHLRLIATEIQKFFRDPKLHIRLSAIWAFNWLNELVPNLSPNPSLLMKDLFEQMLEETAVELRYVLCWAVCIFDRVAITSRPFGELDERKREFIEGALGAEDKRSMFNAQAKRCALILIYYFGLKSGPELLELIKATGDRGFDPHLRQIQKMLQAETGATSSPA